MMPHSIVCRNTIKNPDGRSEYLSKANISTVCHWADERDIYRLPFTMKIKLINSALVIGFKILTLY